ncbi:MAG: methyltransferase domain-containing protein [Bacteroidetes bacterium]|nr:methyltransferase domain-containing protein [Bacteroidota bacterium]
MKVHRNLVLATIQALQQIFNENKQADRVVESLLKSNSKWGSRDRRFIADTIYSVVRWYRLFYENLGHAPQTEQDWWNILAIHWTLQNEELPAFPEMENIDKSNILQKNEALQKVRKIRESIPDWLDEIGEKELKGNWDATIKALNETTSVSLRTNTLKTKKNNLIQALYKEGIIVKKEIGEGLTIEKRAKLTHLKIYEEGWFEVQDISSQMVAPLLDVKPGMTVIDACAGAGGKTLHLAAIMQNKGKLIALDVAENKLRELKKRSERAGVSILEINPLSNLESIKKYYNTADRLLLDVPCTGLGVLRRTPDSKWKITPEFLQQIQKTQQEILQNYSAICKPGGQMIYATCSILPSENEYAVEKFLASEAGKSFSLLEQKSILPQEHGHDGFYMALLSRL